ncbi:MAG TPA: EAL domain-containing protein, partial [Clostridiaceae bacterium]|nr:EAL domain-containing protein [Clostridiaceae bacterium]
TEQNVNHLKIDRPFIEKIKHVEAEDSITNDIISMAHKMGLSVVAEGVEEAHKFEYLKHYGCDRIQGYLISMPCMKMMP